MILCIALLCGFLVLGQLSPRYSGTRLFCLICFLSVTLGFGCTSAFIGVSNVFLMFSKKKRTLAKDKWTLRWWGKLAVAFWISACFVFLGFVSLSWSTQNYEHALALHSAVGLCGLLLVGLWWWWAWKRRASFRFLRQMCLGGGVSLVLLTAYSWFFYPQLVIGQAEIATRMSQFCFFSPGSRKFIFSKRAFTFLTSPKRLSSGHFFLYSQGAAWEWSYHERAFVPEISISKGKNYDNCIEKNRFGMKQN